MQGCCRLARVSSETVSQWRNSTKKNYDPKFAEDCEFALGTVELTWLTNAKEEKEWVRWMTLLERKWPALYGTKLPTIADMTDEELRRLADVVRGPTP